MKTLTNKYKKRRLPILVGNHANIKLLGSASYIHENGLTEQIIADRVFSMVTEWKCKEAVVSMCIDRTAPNTGHVSGVCVCHQPNMRKTLLRCACLWYLTPERCFFSVFSHIISNTENRILLLNFYRLMFLRTSCHNPSPSRHGTVFGKPKFPQNINESTKLSDLINDVLWT